ncbi:MAG: Gingipain R, partial [candidate division Zixibacteria bacterium]|nr:Gingipain R [candidate division Zixibacteria bacterium]NIR62258.1 Gingipain R [candidate division Zixibacteria bacterium]NIS14836.1 Gingipain R [candidate division Zixibacteria bacterium]NIS44494.1 Gingipain R [candidate division Zixibacteria bacterium]NIU12508.1 Gingipain R [candidate division Zixibacteria bacterium]
VLFVGDDQQIPAHQASGHITDLYFCEYSTPGDYFPEVYYGRFSAQNTTQLQPQIDKTLEYEQYLMPDPTYLGEVTLVSGVDASHAPTWGNGQINYGTTYYFNAAHGITPNVWLYPASDGAGAAAAIIQTVQDGIGLYNYTAHCSHTGHADPPFNTSDVAGLTNQHKYGLGIGNCCLSNTFGDDYSTPCFGEAWMQKANGGGIGYIGGTNSTYWDEDYWWGVGNEPVSANP